MSYVHIACGCSQSSKVSELLKSNVELEQTRDDLIAEMEGNRKREAESLEFTERITMMNSHLQSENLHLTAEVIGWAVLHGFFPSRFHSLTLIEHHVAVILSYITFHGLPFDMFLIFYYGVTFGVFYSSLDTGVEEWKFKVISGVGCINWSKRIAGKPLWCSLRQLINFVSCVFIYIVYIN